MLTSVTQDAEHDPRLGMTRLHRFRRALVTPELIYGTIIVSAVIVILGVFGVYQVPNRKGGQPPRKGPPPMPPQQ